MNKYKINHSYLSYSSAHNRGNPPKKLIKITFLMLQNIYMINVLLNFLFITRSWGIYQFPQKYLAAQLISTWMIIIINVSWAPNQHRMMSEGSCDWRLKSLCWKFSFAITGINTIKYTLKMLWKTQRVFCPVVTQHWAVFNPASLECIYIKIESGYFTK